MQLNEWSIFWQMHFDPFDGWDDPENEAVWAETGNVVAYFVVVEVYDTAMVMIRFYLLTSP